MQLVRELGVGDNVTFDDRFLSSASSQRLLASADLFITTYHGREQAVSGALTFALAAGVPAISTPYRYAEDLLAEGAGRLVPFGDPDAVAERSKSSSPTRRARRRTGHKRGRIGAAMSWPAVGRTMAELLGDVVRSERHSRRRCSTNRRCLRCASTTSPRSSTTSASSSTQSARCRTGRRGYCVDDVARLAVGQPPAGTSV